MSEIITSLPESFMREFRDHVLGTIPEEKAQVELRQARNARVMHAVGSTCIEGLGQLKTNMDSRLYFRLKQAHGHHEGWLDDFLADCPELCAPGYRPKQRSLRHGKSFVGGRPI